MKTTNAFKTASDFPTVWEITNDGFLRVKIRALQEGIMPYGRNELSDIPPELDGVDPIMMLVPLDAMSAGDTLRSLEGARVTAPEHEWVTPENAVISKGSAAGSASIEGPFQIVDLLVTDAPTIEKIKNRELGEISGGYHASCAWGQGEWNGQVFHGKQTGIQYNHVAILRPGEGRGGQEVRIMNQKVENEQPQLTTGKALQSWLDQNDKRKIVSQELRGKISIVKVSDESGGESTHQIQNTNQGGNAMSVKVQLRNTGKFINTDEEGAAALADESKASDEQATEATAGSGKKLEELMKEVEGLNAQIAELQATADEGKGELSVYKEKLDELLSDEAAEAQASGMVEESADADEIIENACAGDEKKMEDIKNSIGRIKNTGIYKLRGSALHMAVLNAIGMKADEMAPAEAKGAFTAHLNMAITNKGKGVTKTAVAGAHAFANDNGTPDRKALLNSRVLKQWGKK